MTTAQLFVATTALCAIGVVAAVSRADTRGAARRGVLAAAALASWLALTGWLAAEGALDPPAPPGPMPVVLPAIALAIGIAVSPLGARLAQLPLAALVGFQAFRIPVEITLHRLYGEGLVPVHMTFEGWNFDIVTGILALVVGGMALRRPVPRAVLLGWNVLGLALLATIVTIAFMAFPGFTRVLQDAPANLVPSTVPYVWLPSFLVPLALCGHLLVFRRLMVPSATTK